MAAQQVSNSDFSVFQKQYGIALGNFLNATEMLEIHLNEGYKLGREAILKNIGILNVTAIHQDHVINYLEKLKTNEQLIVFEKATEFFEEVLMSYQMLNTEFRQAITLINLRCLKFAGRVRALQDTIKEKNAAEQRHRSIMENASCGIFIFDERGVISDINKAGEIIFGCTRDQIINKNIRDFVPDSERDYATIQIEKLLVEKTIGPNLGHIQQLNGRVRDVEFTAAYIENAGEKFIFNILNDVTEKNQRHAQTLLADKLVTMGTLTAGIIHEINNPLTWLLSNLDFLKTKIPSYQPKDENQKAMFIELNQVIGESREGANRIREIVKNLKSFSHVDQGEVAWIDVHAALQAAIDMAHGQWKNSVKLKTKFTKNLPLLQMGSGKLQQVFLNLIVNAAQAMKEADLSKNLITITTSLKKNHICIDISDNGQGIAEDVLEKIFEPFFTTKPIGIGTGLGLSICYDIIHSRGGEIDVKSVLGEGTTFTICLPIQLMVAQQEELPLPIITTLKRKKILIVDDDPALLKAIKRILDKLYTITTADGRTALILLVSKKETFDVIIANLEMTDVDGMDLHRYISKNFSGLEKKMIFTTADTKSPRVYDFIKSIKNPWLEKPFKPKQLQDAINTIFEVK